VTLKDIFDARVKPYIKGPEECWIYPGALTSGYGQMGIRNTKYRVHRLAAHLYLGLDLNNEEQLALHKCPNRACFNYLNHLYVGSRSNNEMDKPLKMFCRKGHSLEGDNLYYNYGQRRCKICISDNNKKYYKRKMA